MAYSYYQQAAPGWGTNRLRFVPPPPPTFQPQPYWGGLDFFRAHAAVSDPSIYNYALGRLQDLPDGPMGVGFHEARHWHRRAYGLGDLARMAAEEIGHAAAYEAYRNWVHHGSSLHAPLGNDLEREREALIGFAVAEATRLLQFAGHPLDSYTRNIVSEAAAHTASRIFYQTREGQQEDYQRSQPRYGREGSFEEPYDEDDDLIVPRRHRGRSRSRARSRSRSRHYGYPSSSGATVIQIPGASANYGAPNISPSMSNASDPYYGGSGSYPGVPGVPMTAPSSMTTYPGMPSGGIQYAGSGGIPANTGNYMSASSYSRPRSASFSYPQQYPSQPIGGGYMPGGGSGIGGMNMSTGMAMSMGGGGVPYAASAGQPPQTIIIQTPHRSRSKSRHRHHHHRHRSRH